MNTAEPSTKPTSAQRKSKVQIEDELLRFATTRRGAYRIKKAIRAYKRT